MKKILIITLTSSTTILLLFLVVFFLSKKPAIKNNLPTPTITLVPTPTPKATDLFIQSALPPQNPTEPYLTFQKITLRFSEEVNPIDLVFEVSPPTQTLIRSGTTKDIVYILPREKWEIGKTTITILQATRSTSGKSLYRPYVYEVLTDIPEAPELEMEHP